jgi:hypothetical protein
LKENPITPSLFSGYGVSFCLIVGNISGSIIARRSFGGELNVQSGYYTLGIMVVFAGLMGLYNVKKDTRRHRKWMLRMPDCITFFPILDPNSRHGHLLLGDNHRKANHVGGSRDHHNYRHLLLVILPLLFHRRRLNRINIGSGDATK